MRPRRLESTVWGHESMELGGDFQAFVDFLNPGDDGWPKFF